MGPQDIFQNGLIAQFIISTVALTVLYYDYVLTFQLERRLFWSHRRFSQWGSILFFLNRYCAIIGHLPLVFIRFTWRKFAISLLCNPIHPFRQILGFLMQSIIALIFITRTYALYDRSRVVLIGLISLGLCVVVVGIVMTSQFGFRATGTPGLLHCQIGPTQSQAWRLAVTWGSLLIFHLAVVVLTLVRTLQIRKRSREKEGLTLLHLLIRDGLLYFGVINLGTLYNVVTLLYGTKLMRGIPTTVTNVLASVMVSRLMFNLRRPSELSNATVTTTAAGSIPTLTLLSDAPMNNEEAEEDAVREFLNRRNDIEMDPIPQREVTPVHGV